MTDKEWTLAELYLAEIEARQVADAIALATSLGLFEWLNEGPTSLSSLVDRASLSGSSLSGSRLEHLLNVLVAVGRVEQYGDDFALSQVSALLQRSPIEESALGIPGDWSTRLYADRPRRSDDSFAVTVSPIASETFRRRAAIRQWALTASAIQAAEAIESCLPEETCHLVELGGGASVFSAALSYRCPALRVTSIDQAELLKLARSTYESIGIEDRWESIEADYRNVELPLGKADIVLLPMVVQLHADPTAVILLGRACDALVEGGMVVIIESLDESEAPLIQNVLESLTLALEGCEGHLRSSVQMQRLLTGAGFGDAQWGLLDRGPKCIGLVIAQKVAP